MEEIASSPNIEIHFVDSSGVISWKFLGDKPDYPFHDWNFASTTAEDYDWAVKRLHDDGHDIYISDFTHLGVYACRILVPGVSEIYPIDDLEFENNSIANEFREAVLNLTDLDDEECSDLLDTLNESGLADQRPIPTLIGLAADANSFFSDLRVGELKTLLALAIGDREATLEGCEWVRNFDQLDPARRKIYACIEDLLRLTTLATKPGKKTGGPAKASDAYLDAIKIMYGADTLLAAQELIEQKNRFMGIPAPGLELDGCDMHQKLLRAYGKVHPEGALGA
jgi:ribosomal protein S12 methylthiotransferase accessory factor